MNTCLSTKDGIKARKRHRCDLCGESITAGELQDVRSGVQPGDGFWYMHMHPECHKYECSPQNPVESDWYENISEPAFLRAEAIAYTAAHAARL